MESGSKFEEMKFFEVLGTGYDQFRTSISGFGAENWYAYENKHNQSQKKHSYHLKSLCSKVSYKIFGKISFKTSQISHKRKKISRAKFFRAKCEKKILTRIENSRDFKSSFHWEKFSREIFGEISNSNFILKNCKGLLDLQKYL